jgi:hypothetical protein
VALSAHGICVGLCESPAYWLEVIGASDAPMLTAFVWIRSMPVPELELVGETDPCEAYPVFHWETSG